MCLNDIRLTEQIRAIKNSITSLDEVTAKGQIEVLWDTLDALAKAAEAGKTRLAQIESGL